ncbi:DUF3606 domain-containing protein [Archangium violaceum]|uniref:DUF3606 domain-containing protein n=1 Tax=Archangium violaceum TaxID=83451 RepID=UPI001EF71B0F|nr:DUF3606 domain-containing protein [Archangium violaceum]
MLRRRSARRRRSVSGYWCRKFGCTESELREAVREVGTSAAAVEEYLKKLRLARHRAGLGQRDHLQGPGGAHRPEIVRG